MAETPEQGVTPHGAHAYDHEAYKEDYAAAFNTLLDGFWRLIDNGLEEQVDLIVRKHELCDMNGPKDGLYWATFNLVMLRLLSDSMGVWTRTE